MSRIHVSAFRPVTYELYVKEIQIAKTDTIGIKYATSAFKDRPGGERAVASGFVRIWSSTALECFW